MPKRASIRFDPGSPVPAVRQIVDSLRVLLVEGSLAPGAALPPVRRVAMELGVHFNTVAEAYRQLASEGWLDLKHGRGARVVSRTATTPVDRRRADTLFTQLRGLVAQMRSEGVGTPRIAILLRALAEEITQS